MINWTLPGDNAVCPYKEVPQTGAAGSHVTVAADDYEFVAVVGEGVVDVCEGDSIVANCLNEGVGRGVKTSVVAKMVTVANWASVTVKIVGDVTVWRWANELLSSGIGRLRSLGDRRRSGPGPLGRWANFPCCSGRGRTGG